MKKVICAKDIEALVKAGQKTLYVDAGTLLTPSAKDAVKAAHIEIVEGANPEAAPPASCGQPSCASDLGLSSETIYQALKAMMEKGMLQEVMDAVAPADPYSCETHSSGIKLVRGDSVRPEPLDVGVEGAKVCYRELLGKSEAQTSSGILIIEDSRFDWELAYEETDFVIQGTMTVTVDGQTFTAKAGDMIFLPKGSKVVMGSPDRARIFYTTYPAL